MFTLPPHLVDALSPEVAAYIPTFAPQRTLTASQWARCQEAVWLSCAATRPPSRADAKTQMSVLCAFLAYTDLVLGSVDLNTVLTEDLIQRFVAATVASARSGTRESRRTRLRRSLRAASGDLPRTVHTPRGQGPAPYALPELQRLVVGAGAHPALAAALARGLGAGVVVPAAVGTGPGDLSALQQALDKLGVDTGWTRRVPAAPFTDEDWHQAKADADSAGAELTAARLHATWVASRLAEPGPFVQIAAAAGFTRADLDNAARHRPVVDPARSRELLRG